MELVIIGAGGHASSVAETAHASGWDLIAFIDSSGATDTVLGCPVWPQLPSGYLAEGGVAVVAIGDNATRQRVAAEAFLDVPDSAIPALIHPSASVSSYASIGPGAVVLQGAVVGSRARIGRHCIVNTGSQIDHDSQLEDFASLGPGAILGGKVFVGTRSAVGIGAVVKHGVAIGSDTVVGAASYVHRDLPSETVAFGSPARIQRPRAIGDAYL